MVGVIRRVRCTVCSLYVLSKGLGLYIFAAPAHIMSRLLIISLVKPGRVAFCEQLIPDCRTLIPRLPTVPVYGKGEWGGVRGGSLRVHMTDRLGASLTNPIPGAAH